MAATYSLTQPCCDDCWAERNPGRAAHRFVEGMRDLERCVYCGRETLSGIYVRLERLDLEDLHPTLAK